MRAHHASVYQRHLARGRERLRPQLFAQLERRYRWRCSRERRDGQCRRQREQPGGRSPERHRRGNRRTAYHCGDQRNAPAWADQYEARQIAERTKAEIGSRREATAMATASIATRKANKLELELDRSRQYATVKRMQMLYHGQEFSWRLLKQTSAEMGIPAVDVFDANYGTVKAYHADVWREAYALGIPGGEDRSAA